MFDITTQRVEIISNYPNSPFKLGDILILKDSDINNNYYYHDKRVEIICQEMVDEYPKIFRKMHWWENINNNQLPEYICNKKGRVWKLLSKRYDGRLFGHSDLEMEQHIFWYSVKYLKESLLPATKSDYDKYVNNRK